MARIKPTDELNYKGEPRKRKRYATIDVEELERLSRLHLTNTEIAQWFNCDINTLLREPYRDIIEKGKSETKQRLKQKAIQRALIDNSDVMLIFCLKNYCGWTNNDSVSTKETTVEYTDLLPKVIVKETTTTEK